MGVTCKIAAGHQVFYQGGITHKRDAFGLQYNAQQQAGKDEPTGMVCDAPLIDALQCVHIHGVWSTTTYAIGMPLL